MNLARKQDHVEVSESTSQTHQASNSTYSITLQSLRASKEVSQGVYSKKGLNSFDNGSLNCFRRSLRASERRGCAQQHGRVGEAPGIEEEGEGSPSPADPHRAKQGFPVLRRPAIQSFRVSHRTGFTLRNNCICRRFDSLRVEFKYVYYSVNLQ